MKCPYCGASTNDYGIYKGHDLFHCLKCGTDFKGEEIWKVRLSLETEK